VVGGASDGSVQVWRVAAKRNLSHPDCVWRPTPTAASTGGCAVTSVAVSPTGDVLATRGEDGTVRLWALDLVKKGSAQAQTQKCFRTFSGLSNVYAAANLDFSPDGSLVVCATAPMTKKAGEGEDDPSQRSLLCFLEVGADVKSQEVACAPCLQIAVGRGVVGIAVRWHPKTNQIFVGTSGGATRVFFDPRLSSKGALLTAGKAPKREADSCDATGVGHIYNPHALPLFREELPGQKRRVDRNKKDPRAAKVPEKPPTQGPGRAVNTSFFFTQYVMAGRSKDTSREGDPREALLSMDAMAKADPVFIGRAYKDSQPVTQFAESSFEEEQEEFKKRQKTL